MKEATTVTELATGVAGLEEMLTQIDTRIEGDHAGIAPPYATAEWDEDHNGWTTHFNAKCDPSATPVNAPSVSVNSNPAPATAVAGTPQKKKRNFFQKIFQENDDTSVAMEPSTAPK